MEDLKAQTTHFEFGTNWMNFVDVVDEDRISEAIRGLETLFPDGTLRGRRLLDIGCGSGLSMLASLRLGAREVVGFDIDANSVAAAGRLLKSFAPESQWRASQGSVFDITPDAEGLFDIVYSWGVLHHTGDMWPAIARASEWVRDEGLFAIAIYTKTPFCGFWKQEKRLYTHLPSALQAPARWAYKAAFIAAQISRGQNPMRYIRNYRTRGMSWTHDVHDWLGGYPYESASPEEIRNYLESLGFTVVREHILPTSRHSGLFGSGCNEYVARRTRAASKHDNHIQLPGKWATANTNSA